MKQKIFHFILFITVTMTFLIPLIQLSIGFHFVVKDGQDAAEQCSLAPDLPLLLAIGGVFTLFFLGIAYVLLHMLSTNNQQSDMAGRAPKILIGRMKSRSPSSNVNRHSRFDHLYLRFDYLSVLFSPTTTHLRSLLK